MKFPKRRTVNRIEVPITRICNRVCPECCVREEMTWFNRQIKEKEVSLEELGSAGKYFNEIEQIQITDGEPTMHSRFVELSDNLYKILGCKDVTLISNGWLFGNDQSKLPLLFKYQQVWITHYNKRFADMYKVRTNDHEFQIITKFMEESPNVVVARRKYGPMEDGVTLYIKVERSNHRSFDKASYGGVPCEHYQSPIISYYNGMVYGCCMAWSLKNKGNGIPLVKGWMRHLNEITIPCENCFMSKEVVK